MMSHPSSAAQSASIMPPPPLSSSIVPQRRMSLPRRITLPMADISLRAKRTSDDGLEDIDSRTLVDQDSDNSDDPQEDSQYATPPAAAPASEPQNAPFPLPEQPSMDALPTHPLAAEVSFNSPGDEEPNAISPAASPPSSPSHSSSGSNSSYQAQKHESRCLSEIATNIYIVFEDDRTAYSRGSSPAQNSPPPSVPPSTPLDAPGSVARAPDAQFPATFDTERTRVDDADEEELRTPEDGLAFTHFIRIRHPSSDVFEEPIQYSFSPHSSPAEDGARAPTTITLILSKSDEDLGALPPCGYDFSFTSTDSRRGSSSSKVEDKTKKTNISLTPTQLLAIRDFIIETGYDLRDDPLRPDSSPSSHDSHSHTTGVVSTSGSRYPRILLSTPRNRRMDAVAAVAMHVAWDLEKWVMDVVKGIACDPDVHPIWTSVLSGVRGRRCREGGEAAEERILGGVDEEDDDKMRKADVQWLESVLKE